jgi:hypothetical protein
MVEEILSRQADALERVAQEISFLTNAVLCNITDALSKDNSRYKVGVDLAEPTNSPVSLLMDKKGESWVRVRTLDEDFCIAKRNLDDGKERKWDDAQARLKELGLTTFNRKQAAIISAYRKEIDEALKKIGGEPLKGWFWTSEEYIPDDANVAEYNAAGAWCYYGYGGTLFNARKYYARQSRPTCPSTSIIK